jgi:hypothetical protein
MHIVFDVVAVLILATAVVVRSAIVRMRDGDRAGDPDSQVQAKGQDTVEVVVRNPSGVVLLVSADCRRPSPLVRQPLVRTPLLRHPGSGLKKRSARRRERLRTVDSFMGAVPPHGVERWTVPVMPRAARLYLVLSLSRRRVLLHDHPIPVPVAPPLVPLRP